MARKRLEPSSPSVLMTSHSLASDTSVEDPMDLALESSNAGDPPKAPSPHNIPDLFPGEPPQLAPAVPATQGPETTIIPTGQRPRPTWSDLKELYITLLNHCQRFVPRTPHRYYQRLPERQKFNSAWAHHYTMMIREATPNEYKSPDILIENAVNPEVEPCPPFEFLWTNNLLFGNNVPDSPPQGDGCDCFGPCDPFSTSCECIQRQKKYLLDYQPPRGGFLYNADGTIKDDEYPIFECNDGCGCSDDCNNRVSRCLYLKITVFSIILAIGDPARTQGCAQPKKDIE